MKENPSAGSFLSGGRRRKRHQCFKDEVEIAPPLPSTECSVCVVTSSSVAPCIPLPLPLLNQQALSTVCLGNLPSCFFFFCFPSSQVAHLVPACGLHKKRASLFFFCCCQLRHLSDTVKGVVFLNDITEAITESPGKVVFFSRDSLALLVQFNAPSFSLVFYRLSLFTAA